LALGEEVSHKIGGEMLEDSGSEEAAPGEADAEGAELGKVGGVFVEGSEIVGAEDGCKGRR
jgi:hypothetical protein